jgi:hypothetical protein
MQPSNPSPHLFHPRAAAPSFPSTTQTSETKVSEKTPNTSAAASPSPVVSDHLSLNQGHHEFLLVTLKLLYTRAPPISHEIDAQIVVLRFARHAPARFPTASDLLRPFRDHQCVPGEALSLLLPFPAASDHFFMSPKSDGFVAVLTEVFIGFLLVLAVVMVAVALG